MDTIKAIISDFDGTLFDTIDAHVAAYKLAFEVYGAPFDERLYRNYFGMSWKHIAPKLGVPIYRVNDIAMLKSEYYRDLFDLIRPNTELIQTLEEFNGSVAIATTGSERNVKGLIEYKLGKDHLLYDRVFSCRDIRPKPAPDIYINIMRSIGVNPSEVEVYEDSVYGVFAAQAAGIQKIHTIKLQNNQ